MKETQAGTGAAGVSGLALGGRRLVFLDRARIYACGITPHDVTHLGHAATFVWVDVLARTARRLLDGQVLVLDVRPEAETDAGDCRPPARLSRGG